MTLKVSTSSVEYVEKDGCRRFLHEFYFVKWSTMAKGVGVEKLIYLSEFVWVLF